MTAHTIYFYSKVINHHYAERYLRFIEKFSNTGGTVRHHILPRAKDMWPEFSDLKENPWNESLLTNRQHFVAHWILWKALGGSQTFAFYAMKNKENQRLSSKIYENLKKEGIEEMLIKRTTPNEHGVTSYEIGGKKSAQTRINTIDSDGLNVCQKAYRKALKRNPNLTKIRTEKSMNSLHQVGDDGLSGYQRRGLKIKGDKNPAKRKEVREKIGKANTGKKRSEERKEQSRETAVKMWEDLRKDNQKLIERNNKISKKQSITSKSDEYRERNTYECDLCGQKILKLGNLRQHRDGNKCKKRQLQNS